MRMPREPTARADRTREGRPAISPVVPRALGAVLASLALASPAAAAAPGPLLFGSPRVSVDSASGSGAFGRWSVDRFGLPVYRYTLDQARAPFARQPEILAAPRPSTSSATGGRSPWPRTTASCSCGARTAATSGPTATSRTRATTAGGFGYLRTGAGVTSTLYPDRPRGARTEREFGVGYFGAADRRRRHADRRAVYPPLGGGPLLVHEVTIRNTGPRARRGSWFEYWDANPYDQAAKRSVGMGSPRFSAATRTLSVPQQAEGDGPPPALHLCRRAQRAGARLRHRHGVVLRLRHPCPARRGGRRAPRPVHRAAHRAGIHRPGDAGLPGTLAAAPRTRDHPPLRLRHGPPRPDRRARGTPAQTAGSVLPERATVGALDAPGAAGLGAHMAVARAAVGRATRCGRVRATRSAAAGGSSPRAATTSTTSASRARSATRCSTCSR